MSIWDICTNIRQLYIPLRNRARSLNEIFLLARRVAYRMAVSCFTGVGNHTLIFASLIHKLHFICMLGNLFFINYVECFVNALREKEPIMHILQRVKLVPPTSVLLPWSKHYLSR